MEMIFTAQKMLLDLLKCYTLSSFPTTGKEIIAELCFPSALSYWGDIPQARDMSCIHPGKRGQRPFARCVIYLNDIGNLITGRMKTVHETKEVQNIV